MKKKGKFIVIEGSGGSGKTTQFDLLKERFVRENLDFEAIKFPRYKKPSSHFINSYFDGRYGDVYSVGPYKSSVFFAMDRFDAREDIQDLLGAGKNILADRYIGSNMGYQGAKINKAEEREKYFRWLHEFEFDLLGVARPDLTVVLHIPVATSLELIKSREEEDASAGLDPHELDFVRLKRSKEIYLELTELFPDDFVRINCVEDGELLSKEKIAAKIWNKVRKLI